MTGRVDLQARLNDGGVQIQVGSLATLTAADGTFTVEVASGEYTITASYAGYLSSQRTVMVGVLPITLPAVMLVGGDADGNGVVDLGDLTLVGRHYNTAPPGDPRADINGDGQVDLIDLILVGVNYGQGVYQPWLAGAALGLQAGGFGDGGKGRQAARGVIDGPRPRRGHG